MLFLASLTSTISMSEIGIAWLTQERGMSRSKACVLVIAVAMVCGVACALSFSYWAGLKLPLVGDFNDGEELSRKGFVCRSIGRR